LTQFTSVRKGQLHRQSLNLATPGLLKQVASVIPLASLIAGIQRSLDEIAKLRLQ
jgi:hypothetical protein